MPAHQVTRSPIRILAAILLGASALPAGAQLQDHGPGDAVLTWPQWYRDLDGLAIGLCKSTAAGAAGGQMCFPTPADPGAFAGNIGGEVFYTNLNVNVNGTGATLLYAAALEATYGNVAGTPIKGQELVFSRIRFVMEVKTPECAGDYTIIHPYGRQTYPNVPQGKRALVDTFDVPLGAMGDFEGAVNGSVGPFLRWDDGLGKPAPLLTVGTEAFVGDPNVLHPFVGSPFSNTSDGLPQNYVEVQGPPGCDLDGLGHNVVRQSQGLLMGQVWTAPIPTPTRITKAEYSRSGSAISVDVWARTAPNNVLILTGSGMPSVQMTEDKDAAGGGSGQYHSNIQYAGDLVRTVTVSNITSTPIAQSSTNVVDAIEVTAAYYDRSRRELCVSARSLDRPNLPLLPPALITDGPIGGSLASTGACPNSLQVLQPGELSLTVPLPPIAGGSAAINEPPPSIRVLSSAGGSQDRNVVMSAGTPDNNAGAPVAYDDAYTVSGSGAQALAVANNDSPQNAGKVIIISQPALGSALGSAAGGAATYTPDSTKIAADSLDTFAYVVQDSLGRVSNQATVQLKVAYIAQPPTANPDSMALVRTSTGKTINVAANDVASNGTNLDLSSVSIAQQATRGVARIGTNGNVTYVPSANAAAGADFFTYTIKNTAGGRSAPARVDVILQNGAESVSVTRNRYTVSGAKWDLAMSTTWFGAPLTPTGWCSLVQVGATVLAQPLPVGQGRITTAGTLQIQVNGTKAYNAVGFRPGVDIPQIPAGNYGVRCYTDNGGLSAVNGAATR